MGAWVVAVRRHAGLSQNAFSERIGRARGSVADWERGHKAPDVPSIEAIIRAFPNAPQRPPMVFHEHIQEPASASVGARVPPSSESIRQTARAELEQMKAGLTVDEALHLSAEIDGLGTRLTGEPVGGKALAEILRTSLELFRARRGKK